LSGQATAVAHGAATIVNAIALGKGAAFGVDLWTKAHVELTDEPEIIKAEITSDPNESPLLTQSTAIRVLNHFKADKQFGAKITSWSNIPAARGLKSSSVAANAVVLATAGALGQKLDDLDAVRLGVQAAFDAKVTVTGAFDDASASYFGGVVITDNSAQKIVKCLPLPEDVVVLFHVPPQKAYTINADVQRLKTVKPLVELAYDEALKGNIWDALTLNGLVYSAASNQNSKIAIDALAAGAVAAGLCGKGPSTTAVCPVDKIDSVKVALQVYEGEILQANLNTEKAKVIPN
jgi:shikimate kinase